MHFISQERYNPQSGNHDKYYRIKESFRDAFGRVHSHVLLNVGFIQGLQPIQIRDIGAGLTFMAANRGCNTLFEDCFPDYDTIVKEHIKKYWDMILEKGTLDVVKKNLSESKHCK
ncbi:MAG: hypothetical protein R3Y50_06415 [Rikenellaceae bacterium]